uniref:Uncharacterized protein n=1 Tax=Chromera velia CCMP2878 TaxID=1169474 RepID=A0A0G4F889_9ALVE|eukprot:Cvel_2944.t1-p1 / transcript=Cvel_2944.t1 / gene=Cvel_2944 / organism=Chromera_velia_CCMP2878 / gene_product=hypothetical protein / transcript_product=hypothetical protein / location=Cvel_scaffold116:74500-81646(-) / protein_length=1570 / sequence_SO=supercontig / SO=protein_coding / is_pseudo=false
MIQDRVFLVRSSSIFQVFEDSAFPGLEAIVKGSRSFRTDDSLETERKNGLRALFLFKKEGTFSDVLLGNVRTLESAQEFANYTVRGFMDLRRRLFVSVVSSPPLYSVPALSLSREEMGERDGKAKEGGKHEEQQQHSVSVPPFRVQGPLLAVQTVDGYLTLHGSRGAHLGEELPLVFDLSGALSALTATPRENGGPDFWTPHAAGETDTWEAPPALEEGPQVGLGSGPCVFSKAALRLEMRHASGGRGGSVRVQSGEKEQGSVSGVFSGVLLLCSHGHWLSLWLVGVCPVELSGEGGEGGLWNPSVVARPLRLLLPCKARTRRVSAVGMSDLSGSASEEAGKGESRSVSVRLVIGDSDGFFTCLWVRFRLSFRTAEQMKRDLSPHLHREECTRGVKSPSTSPFEFMWAESELEGVGGKGKGTVCEILNLGSVSWKGSVRAPILQGDFACVDVTPRGPKSDLHGGSPRSVLLLALCRGRCLCVAVVSSGGEGGSFSVWRSVDRGENLGWDETLRSVRVAWFWKGGEWTRLLEGEGREGGSQVCAVLMARGEGSRLYLWEVSVGDGSLKLREVTSRAGGLKGSHSPLVPLKGKDRDEEKEFAGGFLGHSSPEEGGAVEGPSSEVRTKEEMGREREQGKRRGGHEAAAAAGLSRRREAARGSGRETEAQDDAVVTKRRDGASNAGPACTSFHARADQPCIVSLVRNPATRRLTVCAGPSPVRPLFVLIRCLSDFFWRAAEALEAWGGPQGSVQKPSPHVNGNSSSTPPCRSPSPPPCLSLDLMSFQWALWGSASTRHSLSVPRVSLPPFLLREVTERFEKKKRALVKKEEDGGDWKGTSQVSRAKWDPTSLYGYTAGGEREGDDDPLAIAGTGIHWQTDSAAAVPNLMRCLKDTAQMHDSIATLLASLVFSFLEEKPTASSESAAESSSSAARGRKRRRETSSGAAPPKPPQSPLRASEGSTGVARLLLETIGETDTGGPLEGTTADAATIILDQETPDRADRSVSVQRGTSSPTFPSWADLLASLLAVFDVACGPASVSAALNGQDAQSVVRQKEENGPLRLTDSNGPSLPSASRANRGAEKHKEMEQLLRAAAGELRDSMGAVSRYSQLDSSPVPPSPLGPKSRQGKSRSSSSSAPPTVSSPIPSQSFLWGRRGGVLFSRAVNAVAEVLTGVSRRALLSSVQGTEDEEGSSSEEESPVVRVKLEEGTEQGQRGGSGGPQREVSRASSRKGKDTGRKAKGAAASVSPFAVPEREKNGHRTAHRERGGRMKGQRDSGAFVIHPLDEEDEEGRDTEGLLKGAGLAGLSEKNCLKRLLGVLSVGYWREVDALVSDLEGSLGREGQKEADDLVGDFFGPVHRGLASRRVRQQSRLRVCREKKISLALPSEECADISGAAAVASAEPSSSSSSSSSASAAVPRSASGRGKGGKGRQGEGEAQAAPAASPSSSSSPPSSSSSSSAIWLRSDERLLVYRERAKKTQQTQMSGSRGRGSKGERGGGGEGGNADSPDDLLLGGLAVPACAATGIPLIMEESNQCPLCTRLTLRMPEAASLAPLLPFLVPPDSCGWCGSRTK